jgi:hypothetical protein
VVWWRLERERGQEVQASRDREDAVGWTQRKSRKDKVDPLIWRPRGSARACIADARCKSAGGVIS